MEKIVVRKYGEFILEKASFKPARFYMLVKKKFPLDSDNVLGKMIGEVRDDLFDQIVVTDKNYKKLEFDTKIPVINFTEDNDIVEKMIKDDVIQKSSLYNLPDQSSLVSDKVSFHKIFKDSRFVPKTVFTIEDAINLKFPIIAKPADGKSAEGIMKFDSPEELNASKEKFDIFSEMIDISNEYRCFCFKDKILELNRRDKVKNSKDFLKDSETKTDFVYKDIDLKQYDNLKKMKKLVADCKKLVNLDFFSIDFAEDSDGDLHLIEMNSRTGMGADKMTNLYRAINEDFYGKPADSQTEDYLSKIEKDWNKVYKKEKTPLNECTVLCGKLDDNMFLFKNRDRSYTPESEVISNIIKGTEVVYYTDQTGWIEGMNEYGVGFVFSALTSRTYKGYGPSYYMSDEPKNSTNFKKFADKILQVLLAKTADEAVEKIKASGKSGNFLVGDKKKMIEVEVYDGKFEKKEVDLSEIKVKTNHGELIPDAGHQSNGESIKRAGSAIRQHQAKIQLQGVSTLSDLPYRMKFQAFDTLSPMNVFRTDQEEHTISQCMMNLTELKFYFFHDSDTSNSVTFNEVTPPKKIHINIREVSRL